MSFLNQSQFFSSGSLLGNRDHNYDPSRPYNIFLTCIYAGVRNKMHDALFDDSIDRFD